MTHNLWGSHYNVIFLILFMDLYAKVVIILFLRKCFKLFFDVDMGEGHKKIFCIPG